MFPDISNFIFSLEISEAILRSPSLKLSNIAISAFAFIACLSSSIFSTSTSIFSIPFSLNEETANSIDPAEEI